MKKQGFILLILVLTFSVTDLQAQEDWKLKLNREEIKIYSRPFGDSKIKALKVVCTVKATLSQMAAILLDIKSQDEWFFHTKSSMLLQVSPSELFYHAELGFPFPFSNRDFVEHIKISQDPVTKIMIMEVQNVPDYISPQKDFVRVLQSFCKWKITPAGESLVTIEFTLFADPAGSIPVWLVNLFSIYGPFETFKKLKIQLMKPEYRNVHFSFVSD